MPEISIVVIAGTARPYLGAALGSLVAQDYADWEAVVVECAHEGRQTVEEAVARINDPRVRLVHYESDVRFPPFTSRKWNFGAKHATGVFLGFLDDDDEKGSGWLREMSAALRRDSSLATAVSWGEIIAPGGAALGRLFANPSLDLVSLRDHLNFLTMGQVLVRRFAFDEVGAFDEVIGCAEDWDLCLRLAVWPWCFVPGVDARKREHVQNASRHPDVCTYTQMALRRIVEKHQMAPPACWGCQNPVITFVYAVPEQGFKLWCSPPCAVRWSEERQRR